VRLTTGSLRDRQSTPLCPADVCGQADARLSGRVREGEDPGSGVVEQALFDLVQEVVIRVFTLHQLSQLRKVVVPQYLILILQDVEIPGCSFIREDSLPGARRRAGRSVRT
jgi:hypothetical protein